MTTRYLTAMLALVACLGFATPALSQHDDHGHNDHDHAAHEHDEQTGVDDHGDHDGHDHAESEHGDHDHGQHGREADDPAGHDGHGHGEHEGHGHDGGVVRIAPEVLREFDIAVQSADAGSVEEFVRLPGEVVYNADRIAHVTPTVAGIVQEVKFSVGDRVEKGQVMAVLNSRELAAARSEYLAAGARLALAEVNLKRDQRLFEDKVGTERAVLESQQAFEGAEIAVNQAENALHALGYLHAPIDGVESLDDTDFNTYELLAPIGGIVTQRHLTIGEVIQPGGGDAPFVVADLSTVWVNLTVYQRDLAHVKPGQNVDIRFGHGIPDAGGEIAFVSPALDEVTRTATARVVLKNPDGHWRPGLFVSGEIAADQHQAQVVVPRSAVIEMDGEQVVFVQDDEGFEPRPVRLGRTTEQRTEARSGLKPGDRYAARNVLSLKAEMNRAALEHAGHAH